MNKYIAELTGTFALVFAGTGAIIINDVYEGVIGHLGVGVTFGLIVMAMIYSIGNISGAHMNPAVTIAFWVSRRLQKKEVLPYITAQITGAFMASGLLLIMFSGHETLGASLPSGTWQQSFIFELILTFLLMYVILNVSHGSKEEGIMAGAAIGGVVALEAIFAGPVCGASMNPARSLAPAVLSGHTEHLWVYLIATTAGACLSVLVYRLSRK